MRDCIPIDKILLLNHKSPFYDIIAYREHPSLVYKLSVVISHIIIDIYVWVTVNISIYYFSRSHYVTQNITAYGK